MYLPLTYPPIILGASVLTIISYAVYNLFFHPLAGLPGPIGARTGLYSWKSTRAVKLDMGWRLLELHARHGTIVRIARNEASICDPSAISQIYKFNPSLRKTRFYESLRGTEGPTSISTADNKRHAEMRRAESPAYAAKFLINLERHVDACCTDLLAHLDRGINACGGTFDLADVLQFFAIDVVGELTLGKSFGLCKAGRDPHSFLPMLVKFLEIACLIGTQPIVAPIMTWLPQILPDIPSAVVLTRIVRDCIDARYTQREYSDHNDMLDKLMAARNADGSEYSLQQVRAAATSILGAGSGRMMYTMRAIIRFVVGDPRIYAKVQDEIDTAVKNGTIAFPLSYTNASKLTYFQACLKETLRLHPPVPWTLSRSVGSGGVTVAGHYFPEGTEVSMSPFVVHRRPEAYGEDSATFRPERWINADAERRTMMERNNLAFGHGTRVCIGKNIGLMEVSKVVPLLFYRYKIRFTPRSPTSPHTHRVGRASDGRASMDEPYVVTSQWVAVQSDFWCDITWRTEP
ncbi:cytochrome P450 oxidoreductase [Mycena sp. CBHHK59/15]|nr:cytochrome P450 oxidoreductase [Mycena sp. CBHHK59/15]